jgi:hypothetical protein
VGKALVKSRPWTTGLNRDFSTGGLDDFGNVTPELRDCTGQLPCNLFLQETVRFFTAFQHLVGALHELDKFSSVDVWVSRALNIISDFWRYVDENVGSCVRQLHEILNQCLADLLVSNSRR